jgi:hypothetical protein
MMDEVEVPTFLCRGENIVEVMYSRWGEVSVGEWRLLDRTPQVVISEQIDRVVFELPTGCFDVAVYGPPGADIGFRPFDPTSSNEEIRPARCERPHGYEEAQATGQSPTMTNDRHA